MEFNEKLQELRRKKGMTQEELADSLFVSRTAISKWESGRGYPNIDSLKAIARFFEKTIDELLSGDELLNIAESDTKQKAKHICDMVFGLLDISVLMFFFLPFFAQKLPDTIREIVTIQEVSLLHLTQISPYLRITYFVVVLLIVLLGVLTLALQNLNFPFWVGYKNKISLFLNIVAVILFVISLQPYAATLLLVYLTLKVILLIKKQ